MTSFELPTALRDLAESLGCTAEGSERDVDSSAPAIVYEAVLLFKLGYRVNALTSDELMHNPAAAAAAREAALHSLPQLLLALPSINLKEHHALSLFMLQINLSRLLLEGVEPGCGGHASVVAPAVRLLSRVCPLAEQPGYEAAMPVAKRELLGLVLVHFHPGEAMHGLLRSEPVAAHAVFEGLVAQLAQMRSTLYSIADEVAERTGGTSLFAAGPGCRLQGDAALWELVCRFRTACMRLGSASLEGIQNMLGVYDCVRAMSGRNPLALLLVAYYSRAARQLASLEEGLVATGDGVPQPLAGFCYWMTTLANLATALAAVLTRWQPALGGAPFSSIVAGNFAAVKGDLVEETARCVSHVSSVGAQMAAHGSRPPADPSGSPEAQEAWGNASLAALALCRAAAAVADCASMSQSAGELSLELVPKLAGAALALLDHLCGMRGLEKGPELARARLEVLQLVRPFPTLSQRMHCGWLLALTGGNRNREPAVAPHDPASSQPAGGRRGRRQAQPSAVQQALSAEELRQREQVAAAAAEAVLREEEETLSAAAVRQAAAAPTAAGGSATGGGGSGSSSKAARNRAKRERQKQQRQRAQQEAQQEAQQKAQQEAQGEGREAAAEAPTQPPAGTRGQPSSMEGQPLAHEPAGAASAGAAPPANATPPLAAAPAAGARQRSVPDSRAGAERGAPGPPGPRGVEGGTAATDVAAGVEGAAAGGQQSDGGTGEGGEDEDFLSLLRQLGVGEAVPEHPPASIAVAAAQQARTASEQRAASAALPALPGLPPGAAAESGGAAGSPPASAGLPPATAPAVVNMAAEEDGCIVCMDAPKQTVLGPCGHHALCLPCTLTLFQQAPERRLCPYCRAQVTQHLRLFSV